MAEEGIKRVLVVFGKCCCASSYARAPSLAMCKVSRAANKLLACLLLVQLWRLRHFH